LDNEIPAAALDSTPACQAIEAVLRLTFQTRRSCLYRSAAQAALGEHHASFAFDA
jgi:hypothetical protein